MGLYYDHLGLYRQCLLLNISRCCGFTKHRETYRFIYLFYSSHLQASYSTIAKGDLLLTLSSTVRINLLILHKVSKQ